MIKFTPRPGLTFPPNRRLKIIQQAQKSIFTQKNRALLNKYTTSVPLPMVKALVAEAAVAPGGVLAPVMQFVHIPAFVYPIFGEDGQTITGWETIPVTAANWLTTQFGLRWDWMYRVVSTVVPIKPPFIVENSQLGMASIVLPATQAYEYLPLFR